MRKLTLDVESIAVESFLTSEAGPADWIIPTTLKTNPTCCPCTP